MRFIDLLSAGGIVMWPLLGFSLVAIVLIIERLFFWLRLLRRQDRVVRDVLRGYRSDFDAAVARLEKNIDLPIARIFLDAMHLEKTDPETFRIALESATQAELPLMKRFNTFFETVISIAPLLGLLGTILGLMRSFASLQLGEIGGEATANVTGGISEALVSTAAGLVVAIFVLLFSNSFKGFYRRQVALIQEYGGQLELLHRLEYLQSQQPDQQQGQPSDQSGDVSQEIEYAHT